MSILAGMMIAVGATCYLVVGGVPGAVMFAVGLMAVLTFKMYLFTGQAGKIPTGEIKIGRLLKTWAGNLYGACLVAVLLVFTPLGGVIVPKAAAIVATRIAISPIEVMIYAFFCGLLMYCAVAGYEATGSWLSAIFPVAVFIMCGFVHCVADMFYFALGCDSIIKFIWYTIPATFGNFIGCCTIPIIKNLPR